MAKVRALYPEKQISGKVVLKVEAMVEAVKDLLGQTQTIEVSDLSAFYSRLQQFVDSKEKKVPTHKKHHVREREL